MICPKYSQRLPLLLLHNGSNLNDVDFLNSLQNDVYKYAFP